MAFKSSKKNIEFFESITVPKFNSREAAYEYLEKEVFIKKEFSLHISETSKTLDISYLLAYEIITNYLTDILYEIDKAVSNRKKRKKINVLSYFSLQIGFMLSLQYKKMFLEKLIKY